MRDGSKSKRFRHRGPKEREIRRYRDAYYADFLTSSCSVRHMPGEGPKRSFYLSELGRVVDVQGNERSRFTHSRSVQVKGSVWHARARIIGYLKTEET